MFLRHLLLSSFYFVFICNINGQFLAKPLVNKCKNCHHCLAFFCQNFNAFFPNLIWKSYGIMTQSCSFVDNCNEILYDFCSTFFHYFSLFFLFEYLCIADNKKYEYFSAVVIVKTENEIRFKSSCY